MDEESLFRGKLRFGDVILDLSSAEIERGGTRQRLPDQAFEVLRLLTERRGDLVTRTELIARLWPTTTFIDTDAGLNTAVKKLRAALGDDAERPRYVETVPRRGYRFIAQLDFAAPSEIEARPRTVFAPASVAELPVSAIAPVPLKRRHFVTGTVSVAVVTALVAWLWGGGLSSRAPIATSADPVMVSSGNVAVLPFLNLTGDPQRDDFALGFAESVLHEIAQLRGINVIAHTSSFAFRHTSIDIREIGRKLNARYILEGSFQGSATRLRITTQLIDASSGTHLWSKSFDRPIADVFAIQDEISHEVAKVLALSVTDSDGTPPRSSGTRNLDAWLAFQQGRKLAATRRSANLDAAVTSLERAVQLDSQFARAYVELADAYLLRYQYSPVQRAADAPHDADRRAAHDATVAVARALAIDPRLSDALIVRGHAAALLEDFATAEADYRAGLALSPNNARGYQLLGEMLVDERGRDEEGLAMIGRARLLDPLEPRGPYYQGIIALLRRNLTEAERLFLVALEQQPDYAPALGRLSSLSWWGRGQFADAVKYGEIALHADPQSEWVRALLVASYIELGELETARRVLPPESGERIGAAQIRFLDRDYRGAGALVYAESDRSDVCDWSVEPYIVLEHARVTGDYTRARHFLEQRASRFRQSPSTVSPQAEASLQANPPVVRPGAEHAATVLAQVVQLSGDRVAANRLLETTLAQLDRAVPPLSGQCVNVSRTRARALALLGREAEALDALKRAVLGDNAWYHGWYLFHRDSAYARLRANPEFLALRAAYRARIDAERNKLVELRLAGLVAPRP
jgi:TolB-like protein/DNA-binding winged helix-turn-helix (wHTH) protein/Flp pilus assembly protein TadD